MSILASTWVVAGQVPVKAPKPLLAQVQRLAELLRDSHATWYREATMVQFVKTGGEEVALAVFTVEGFGGGNNHTQYFAAFSVEPDGQGAQHFSFLDVLPIAGKGWRGITNLSAKVSHDVKGRQTLISLDAFEVSGDDAPNFPSKKATIKLVLEGGRLAEQKQP